jgi:transmembrane sensor
MITRLSGAQSYSTRTGQRSTFVLDDGSSIDLNARSRIEVRFSNTRRDVTLVEGQALFNVAREPRRPFIVHAGNQQVLAVGTRFDVRLDTTSVQVTLLEGRVRVEERGHEVELTPGKQLVTRLNTATPQLATTNVIRDIDVAKVTGWREGRIYFDDLTLAEAVREMNRHSTVHIRIESPDLAELRINGMFKAGEQELFVSALQDYFQIAAQRRGTREIVLTNR